MGFYDLESLEGSSAYHVIQEGLVDHRFCNDKSHLNICRGFLQICTCCDVFVQISGLDAFNYPVSKMCIESVESQTLPIA